MTEIQADTLLKWARKEYPLLNIRIRGVDGEYCLQMWYHCGCKSVTISGYSKAHVSNSYALLVDTELPLVIK